MAILAPYTDQTFAQFLHAVLGRVATALGWSVGAGSYDLVIEETKLILGEGDLSTITEDEGIRELRAIGRWSVWQHVANDTAGDFQFSADGGSYSPQQFHEHALAMAARYEMEAAEFGHGQLVVTTAKASYGLDPYKIYDVDEIATELDQYDPA